MPLRILKVKVEYAGAKYRQGEWNITAACSDGLSRTTRVIQLNEPTLDHAQDNLDRWPSLWEVAP